MTFGYESQWFCEHAIRQDLSSVPKNLLLALRRERGQCRERPLIFIGHSYGGLVIQKTLVTAKLHSESWPGLYSSTCGVVFLGTPHRGTGDITSQGMMDAIIEQYSQCQIEEAVLQSLKSENERLNDVRKDFLELCTRSRGKLELVCFYEQKSTGVGRIIGVDSMSVP